jgi:putative tricarboxylic transport membrane protein
VVDMVSIHKKMKGWLSIKKLITSDGFVSGVFFVLVGVIGLWVAKGYQVGTAHQMGSGYFPRLLCIGMIILGSLSMLLDSSKEENQRLEAPLSKALFLIPLAIVIFGLTYEPLGFVLSTALMIIVASQAHSGMSLIAALLTTIFLVLLCVLVFVWGFNLPLSLWPDVRWL